MSKQKNSKVMPATLQAKMMEAQLKSRFRNTPSEAKISGEIPQTFNRVLDIETIPGWGVEVKLRPTKEDPSTSRRISYYQALQIVVQMERILVKVDLKDMGAVAEMFTKFKLKLLEAVNADNA